MAKEFTGKRVIVMGGSRGIGRSIALGFAAGGASVSICARSAGPLEATRREIEALGVTAHAGVTMMFEILCSMAEDVAKRRS